MKSLVFDRVPWLLRRGPSRSRRVALTFDDGPGDLTPRYLDLLDELGVPATFFLLGEQVAKRPGSVQAYLRRGHHVASHGFDHRRFTELSRAEMLGQCARADAALGGQMSGRPWIRPPHGAVGATQLASLLAASYTVALWSLDSRDWEDRDPSSIAARCTPDRLGGGEVLLFHEEQMWTLDALPLVVAALHGAGYECVTMHDLFAS